MAAVFDQAQSPQDVADVKSLAALTDVSPKLRYQTSDSVTERAATKLADTTGSGGIGSRPEATYRELARLPSRG